MDLGIEKRKFILQISLLIESLTTIFLARLLEIEDRKETISFSNKSSSLSFNQRLNLLIDIRAIEAKNKTKFLTFMEIRNQFMHNLEAASYELCFSYMEGKENYILKTYPQDPNQSKEKQLEKATEQLSNEVVDIAARLYEKVKEKITKEVKYDMLEKTQPILLKAVADIYKKK